MNIYIYIYIYIYIQFRWILGTGVKVYAVFHNKENTPYKIMEEHKLYTEAIFADMDGDDAADKIIAEANKLGTLSISSRFGLV